MTKFVNNNHYTREVSKISPGDTANPWVTVSLLGVPGGGQELGLGSDGPEVDEVGLLS